MKELITYKLSKEQREQGRREKEQIRKLEAKRKRLENKPEVVQDYERIILYLKKDIHPDLADGKLSTIALELLKLERENQSPQRSQKLA